MSDTGTTGVGGSDGFRGGRFGIRNATLKHLISIAYEVEPYRVEGGPSWLGSERYTVEARPPAPVDDKTARLMLQALLAERFGLRLHRTTKMVGGYTLLAEKGEQKLERSKEDREGFRIMSTEEIEGPGTMAQLTRVLKAILGSPVQDRTGLGGKYAIRLKWKDTSNTDADFGLSIFTALKLQLGLSLKAEKIPIEVLVIDEANKKPAEN